MEFSLESAVSPKTWKYQDSVFAPGSSSPARSQHRLLSGLRPEKKRLLNPQVANSFPRCDHYVGFTVWIAVQIKGAREVRAPS
jgi:hypothetical protein